MRPSFLFLLLCAATTSAAAADLQCTTIPYDSPESLSSTEKLCTSEVEGGVGTAAVGAVTGDTAAPTVGGDRNGGAFFDSILASQSVNMDDLVKYIRALVPLVAPCVIFLIVNCCSCTWCTCMHTCCHLCPRCCRCCKCLPTPDREYTKFEKLAPIGVWFLFSCGLVAVAVAGAVNGVYKFSDSLVDGVCTMDNAFLRFDVFLNNVNKPLTRVETDFNDAVEELDNSTTFPPELTENVEQIGTEFGTLSDIASRAKTAVGTKVDNNSAPCSHYWETVVSTARDAETSTQESAEKLSETLRDIQQQLNSSIIEAKEPALKSLRDGRKALDDMRSQLTRSMDPRSYDAFRYAQIVRDNRDNSGYAQFFWVPLALFLSFAGLTGIVFCRHEGERDEPPLNNENMSPEVYELSCPGACSARVMACSWFIVIAFGTLGALFALIFLPLTAVVSDACTVLPDLPLQLGEFAGNDQLTNISETCWDPNRNLFQGLGINEQIQLDGIDFGNFTADFETPTIERSGIQQFSEALESVPPECDINYGVNDSWVDQSLAQNRVVNASITRAEDGFANNPVPTALAESGEAVVNTLLCAVQGFETATRCTFVKTIWLETVDVLCQGMNGSIQWIATAELVIAILAMPYMVTVLFLLKRFAGHGPTMMESKYAAAADVSLNEIEAADASGFDKSTYGSDKRMYG